MISEYRDVGGNQSENIAKPCLLHIYLLEHGCHNVHQVYHIFISEPLSILVVSFYQWFYLCMPFSCNGEWGFCRYFCLCSVHCIS